jgi:hypothetical protein
VGKKQDWGMGRLGEGEGAPEMGRLGEGEGWKVEGGMRKELKK